MSAHLPRSLPALLIVVALGSGCAGAGASPEPAPAPAATPARQPNPADLRFINGMIHHHSQALVMAELARTRAGAEAVRTLSERIHVSQTDEIRLMQLWLSDNGQPVPQVHVMGTTVMIHGPGHEHTMMMPGMLTQAELDQLERSRGAEFDRLFLRLMIRHHEGALQMVEELLASPGAANDDVIYRMASDTFADQGIEIDRMRRLLDALEGSR